MALSGIPLLLRAEMEKTVGSGGLVTALGLTDQVFFYGPLPTVIK